LSPRYDSCFRRSPPLSRLRAVTLPALEAVPGLVHGFEQRVRPDGCETGEEAARRASAALGCPGRLLLLRQVHGSRIARAPWDEPPTADAAIAAVPGPIIGIQTADCLPVLLVDPRRRAVAAAHAGWRGTAARVVRELVAVLLAEGSRTSDLLAGLGPAIGPCCYEVGEEVRAALGPAAAAAFRPGPRGRPHLDLRAANRLQLLEAGLRRENLHVVDDCTACRPELYHSYRRDGPRCGRMISWIGYGA